jgi:hypothetical protein
LIGAGLLFGWGGVFVPYGCGRFILLGRLLFGWGGVFLLLAGRSRLRSADVRDGGQLSASGWLLSLLILLIILL